MTERREIVISVINKGGAEFWFIGFGVKWTKSFIGVRKKWICSMNLQIGNHLSIYWNWSPKFSPYFAESTILPKPEDKQLDIFLGKSYFFF